MFKNFGFYISAYFYDIANKQIENFSLIQLLSHGMRVSLDFVCFEIIQKQYTIQQNQNFCLISQGKKCYLIPLV